MILNLLCGPTITYVFFTLIHIFTDIYKGNDIKLLVISGIFYTILLQILCMKGLNTIAWIIVFIPIIMYTYTTIVIFSVFGLNPNERIKHYLI